MPAVWKAGLTEPTGQTRPQPAANGPGTRVNRISWIVDHTEQLNHTFPKSQNGRREIIENILGGFSFSRLLSLSALAEIPARTAKKARK